ncbi:hypothetical protein AQUCO_01000590v1 [Aquilegia coerulea]|uniref:PGG domain-containing protein n=1 Tax=Aquilegia coerulea TaxID=218851 RepID=A0A2G5EAL6_AQUCA|nr:hypothetical protein AQUCO_01000590v1 [Aquilegia coerulea]
MDLFNRVKKGDLDYIKTVQLDVLLKARDEDGMSVLSIAAIHDHLDCCKEILERCPSLLYHQNNFKNTVLHHATYYGIGSGIFRLIDFFVSFGLDVAKNDGDIENGMVHFQTWIKLQNHNADTGLTQAVYYRNHDIVRRFVEVDRQYKIGLSEIAGYKGKTALQLAVEYQDQVMLKLLTDGQDIDLDSLSFPVDLFDRVKSGDLEYIKTVPQDVLQNTRDDYQMSALSIATIEDHLDCCKEILRRCPSLLYHQNSMKNTVLHHATYYGNGIFRLVDFFVSAGLNAAKNEGDIEQGMARFKRWIKLQNHNADTGLTQAAYYRNHDIVRKFVEVDRQYKQGLSEVAGYKRKTALQLAMEFRDHEMIKLLVDGRNPGLDYGAISNKSTPVSTAVDLLFDRVKCGDLHYIKKIPQDVLLNTRDEDGMSLLSIATINNQLDCCNEILRRCPSLLYYQNNFKNTVLHHATYYGNGIFRLIEFFVSAGLDAATKEEDLESKGENMIRFTKWMKLQNHNADTALTQAAYYRNLHIVKRLVEVDRQYKLGLSEIAGYNRKTALHLAVEYDDHEMVKMLTDEGDSYSNYIPHSISVDLFDRVKYGDLVYIKTVRPDVLLNSRDEDRMSALSIATINYHLDCCEEILKRCPSLLYHQNNFKNTVLHHATYYGRGTFRLINFFVSVGLNVAKSEGDILPFKRWFRLQNHNADTALTQAAYYRNHDIVKRLVEVDRQHKLGLLEMAGHKRKTALQLALEYQDHAMIKMLTEGEDPDGNNCESSSLSDSRN